MSYYTAGLAEKPGSTTEDEIAEFLKRGGKITRVPVGVAAIPLSEKGNIFRKAFREGRRINVGEKVETVLDTRTDVRKPGATYTDGAGRKILAD